MAEEELDQNDQALDENEPSESGGRSLFSIIKVVAFVVTVITIECAIAYLYVPSASLVKAHAEARFGDGADDPDNLEEGQEEEQPTIEVDLGEFSVTGYQPISHTALRIDFHLYATIYEEDQEEFDKRFSMRERTFRDQVISTTRSSPTSDLTDAGLGLIKRKIKDKSNRILGKPLLQTILFSDFSFVEQ